MRLGVVEKPLGNVGKHWGASENVENSAEELHRTTLAFYSFLECPIPLSRLQRLELSSKLAIYVLTCSHTSSTYSSAVFYNILKYPQTLASSPIHPRRLLQA